MASSPTGGIDRNEDTSSDSDDDAEENENLAEVEARIATLQIQV